MYSMAKFWLKFKKSFNKREAFLLLFLFLSLLGSFFIYGQLFDSKKDSEVLAIDGPSEIAENARKHCYSEKENGTEERINCYVDYYYNVTLRRETETSFKSMLELQKIDDGAKSCHFILHSIGRAAFEKDPENWKENLQKMPEECDYGGLHGILEAYQAEGGSVDRDNIPSLCGNDEEGGCIHAVGHLVLIEKKNNLGEALDLCEAFVAQQDRHHCMAGAFMERMIPRNLVAHGLVSADALDNWWSRLDEFEELCLSYSGEQATACWTETSHAAIRTFRAIPKRVFEYCDTGPSQEAANSCRRHVIIDIVGSSRFDILGIKGMCKLGPEYDPLFEGDCYNEIVKSAIIGLHADLLPNVSMFCRSLEDAYQSACYRTTADAISKRSMDSDDKEKLCYTLPSRYYKSCINESSHGRIYKENI
jgi:hypothetical protein